MYKTPLAEAEYKLSVNRFENAKALMKFKDEGVVISLPASVIIRSSVRKPRELFDSYKRGMRNSTKALKIYLKAGPDARVNINRKTMVVI